jgi:hypothetical protein
MSNAAMTLEEEQQQNRQLGRQINREARSVPAAACPAGLGGFARFRFLNSFTYGNFGNGGQFLSDTPFHPRIEFGGGKTPDETGYLSAPNGEFDGSSVK